MNTEIIRKHITGPEVLTAETKLGRLLIKINSDVNQGKFPISLNHYKNMVESAIYLYKHGKFTAVEVDDRVQLELDEFLKLRTVYNSSFINAIVEEIFDDEALKLLNW